MKSISWCVTVCDELTEITTLLNFLQQNIRDEDEIVVQYDLNKVSEPVLEYLTLMDKIHDNHTITGFPLNNDFATFKNNLKKHSTKDYIFQCDADEIPHENLMNTLGELLESNPVDLIFVPRINTVDGITQEHVDNWNWKVSKLETQVGEKEMDTESDEYKYLKKLGYITGESSNPNDTTNNVQYYLPVNNFPDFQTRIYRRTPDIEWLGKVHERITGYDTFSNFPAEEIWCMYHYKSISKQESQNSMYEKI